MNFTVEQSKLEMENLKDKQSLVGIDNPIQTDSLHVEALLWVLREK